MSTGVLASMATDFYFPSIKYTTKNQVLELVSGSIKYSVDILSGVNACE